MKGRCVICGRLGPLTRDHVPPKGVTPPRPIEVSRLTDILGGQATLDHPHRRYQSPDFPSLCTECNTDRLGRLYDPHLVSFADELATWVRGAFEIGLMLPERAPIKIRAQSVARAVVGHLLAAEERGDATSPLSEGTLAIDMRAYFLGEKAGKPAGFQIYVWPYNGIELVIIRGFAMARVLGRKHGPVIGDILKFFPVAFWVVAEQAPDVEIQFAPLDLSTDQEAIIDIPLRRVPPWGWPERPRDDEIVVVSADRTHISRRIKSRPRAT